tara:strand:+ start:1994 stop:5104 length:3111 start_codon:yes stop_codon:yes gene_type:complete
MIITNKSTVFIQFFKKILSIFLITCLFSEYGKNIVQYDEFDWHFIQTKHFDIYYYGNGENNVEFVASHAEKAHDKIEKYIGWGLNERSAIIYYNSHNEFQQTNVIESYMREGIGGVTELIKNRMVIPYDGSLKDFSHVIYHELVHVFINDGMYGGSLQNLMSSNNAVFIPLWMNEGLAEYLAHPWDVNSDMWMRDLAINSSSLPNINDLNGYLAYRGGQSVWKFICEKWGEESIAEIFYSIKTKGSINKGIKSAIGIDIKELTKQWHKYLKKEYWPDIDDRDDIQDIARQITNHEDLKNNYNIGPSPSPDGQKIAMYSNINGEMGIYIISMLDGQFLDKVTVSNKSAKFEELHFLKPGISWSYDNKKIVFSAKSNGDDALFIYDVDGKRNNFQIFKFDGLKGIFKPIWNPQNNQIAFIGNNGYSSDVYVYNLDDGSLVNLTNDHFSDIQVNWHPNGKLLLFSSDRGKYLGDNSTLDFDIILNHDVDNYDIYQINFDNEITRLTNTDFNETYASFSPDGNFISYLSDESGINNIYIADKNGKNVKPATNVLTGITQFKWVNDNQIIFTGFYKSGYDIFLLSNVKRSYQNIKNIPKSKWKEKKQLDLLRKSKNNKKDSYNDLSNYVFSADNFKNSKNSISFNAPIFKDSTGRYHKHKYLTRFTMDYASASYTYDSYYGASAMGVFVFSDILGDHRAAVGIELQKDITESDFFIQYRYLKKQINHEAQFYHRAYKNYSLNNFDYILYKNLGFEYRASKPFSRFSRIEGGLSYNYYMKKQYSLNTTFLGYDECNDPECQYPDRKIVMPYAKYVYDNTRWFYLYPVSGSRLYLKYDLAPDNGLNDFSYHMLTLDARKYYELSYNGKISFASRFYAGSSWGNNKRQYAIGGTPWVGASDDDLINQSYQESLGSDDYYYMNNFVLPIRGYELAARYGNKALLMNFELRLPMLMYYFPTIQYLGQLFGVFFVDMGVAWNDQFPKYNNQDSWSNNNGEGWIMSYGFGPRFIFLGMPWKLDYAWEYDPYEGKKSDRKWYLSIGLDF